MEQLDMNGRHGNNVVSRFTTDTSIVATN